VLDGLARLKVAVAYELAGKRYDELPPPMDHLACATPVYEELPAWRGSVAGARAFDELPPEARSYIVFVERYVGAPVAFVSTGPGREEGFWRERVW